MVLQSSGFCLEYRNSTVSSINEILVVIHTHRNEQAILH
jgi:hypothetical protein